MFGSYVFLTHNLFLTEHVILLTQTLFIYVIDK